MNDRHYANPNLLYAPSPLSERLGENKLLVIDVRPTADYVRGHLNGFEFAEPSQSSI